MPKRRVVRTDTFRVVIVGKTADVYQIPAQNHSKHVLGKRLGTIWIDHTNAWNVEFEPGNTYLPTNWVLGLLNYGEKRQLTLDFSLA